MPVKRIRLKRCWFAWTNRIPCYCPESKPYLISLRPLQISWRAFFRLCTLPPTLHVRRSSLDHLSLWRSSDVNPKKSQEHLFYQLCVLKVAPANVSPCKYFDWRECLCSPRLIWCFSFPYDFKWWVTQLYLNVQKHCRWILCPVIILLVVPSSEGVCQPRPQVSAVLQKFGEGGGRGLSNMNNQGDFATWLNRFFVWLNLAQINIGSIYYSFFFFLVIVLQHGQMRAN